MTTKKDFIQAAKEIANMQDRTDAKKVAETMAKIFAGQNPRFDFGRFYSACGIEK